MTDAKPFPRLLLMLPLVLGFLLALLYWRGLTLDPNQVPSRLLGKPLPLFQLPALSDDARLLSSKSIQGPALINVWASWCAACRTEHVQLLKIGREYALPVYGIVYQDERDQAQIWLAQQGEPFRWVMFDAAGSVSGLLDIFSVPQTYVIDADGIVRYRHIGEVTEKVWQTMRTYLKTSPIDGSRP